jgi:hypothetical protein
MDVMVLLMVALPVTMEFVPHLETLFIDAIQDAQVVLIVPMLTINVITVTMDCVQELLQHLVLSSSAICNAPTLLIAPELLMAAYTAIITVALQPPQHLVLSSSAICNAPTLLIALGLQMAAYTAIVTAVL